MVTITGEIIVDSDVPGVDADRLGPFTLQIDRDGSTFRRRIALTSGVPLTPNMDGLTPWLIAIFNTGTKPVTVSFGAEDPIVLDVGGPPAQFTGATIPALTANGGDSEVVFFAITAA
jgi:hypothetical protein